MKRLLSRHADGRRVSRTTAYRSLRGFEPLETRVMLAGDVVYRVNAGGGQLAGDPVWEGDSAQYVNTGALFGGGTNITLAGSVPAGTPAALFETERYDGTAAPEMSWAFPVTPGQYEVRLYFAETFGSIGAGGRVFDVSIEGQLLLNDYDPFVAAGNALNRGVAEIFTIDADNVINIDFQRVVQNPAVKGFEIITLDQTPNELSASRASVAFGDVVLGQSESESLTLRNIGDPGDPLVMIDPAQATVSGGFAFQFAQGGPITLAPGETTLVNVVYTPLALGAAAGTLTIPHSGLNPTISVALSAQGVDPQVVGFGKSTLDPGSATLDSPTSLQFGPDGRLYVAQTDGFIRVLDIVRNGPNDYSVAASETISVVRDIPNFNDDGAAAPGVAGRLITGILVGGTAESPVIYVSNSDPRFYSSSIDSKSGQIARITKEEGQWIRHDVVRGLPRSKADHASNGLAWLRDENGALTNTLLHSIGGNTNRGGPSNSFRDLPEMALSAAIIAIDLDAIGETTYDIPSLDDEDRANTGVVDAFGVPIDVNDHVGGNSGKNQSRLVPGGPVSIYSPGYRNPFDVLVTEDGRVYATDNGPNNGFGVNVAVDGQGLPTNATVPGSGDGVSAPDQLHYIPALGFFAGHVNPTRANANNTFNTSNPQSPVITTVDGAPVSLENPGEFPMLEPGSDGALRTFNGSTNGIAEYTANNFGGQLKGDILTISLNGNLTRVKHDPISGQLLVNEVLANGLGPRSLDVTTVGAGPLAGTIWVTSLDGDAIRVLEPNDGAGGNPDDLDGDGYLNQDEIDNGTNPNNAASVPTDYDLDFTSDLNDPDDDNDLIVDIDDPFAIDATNGAGNPIGTYYAWANEATPAGKLLDLGLTGSMTNGATNYLDTFDPALVTPIGAAGVFNIDSAQPGTARGAANNIQQALQFGFHVAQETTPFTAVTEILAPNDGVGVPSPGQEQGFYLGTGDQDNYVALILSGDSGGSIQVLVEVAGALTVVALDPFTLPTPDNVALFLTVDPLAQTVQAAYRLSSVGALTPVGPAVPIPQAWLAGSMALGLWSSDPTGANAMPVTWNHLGVVREITDRAASANLVVNGGGSQSTSSTAATNAFMLKNTSRSGQELDSVRIDLSTALLASMVFDPNGAVADLVGKTFTPNSGANQTGYLGFSFDTPFGGGFSALNFNFDDFGVGETFGFSADIDPVGAIAAAANVSGLELAGATLTVMFSDGTSTVSRLAGASGSTTASFSESLNGALEAPGVSMIGIGELPNVVAPAGQTIRLTGPAGARVVLQQWEASSQSPASDPFAADNVLAKTEQVVVLGPAGVADVPVVLRFSAGAGLNLFVAELEDSIGRRSGPSHLLALARPAGGAPFDYDASGLVDQSDYQVWRKSFGSTTNLAADGNGDGVIDAADYSAWRDHLGEVVLPPPAPALMVNIDFGGGPTYSGAAAAPVPGTTWNKVLNTAAPGTGGLNDATGQATTVSLSFSTISQFDTGSDTEGERGPGDAYNPLMQDYLFTTGSNSFTLSGLEAGASYDLYLYGQGDKLNQETAFTLGGQTLTTSFDTQVGGNGAFAEGVEFVVFRSAPASAAGTIDFSIAGVANNGGFNGLQLVSSGAAPAIVAARDSTPRYEALDQAFDASIDREPDFAALLLEPPIPASGARRSIAPSGAESLGQRGQHYLATIDRLIAEVVAGRANGQRREHAGPVGQAVREPEDGVNCARKLLSDPLEWRRPSIAQGPVDA
ncbi:Di-glucose binding within endoplasmic reticulum [Pirellulimonas nuda]|uniref:Di-glucose binding within endoplasmic reticulum n=1 Tax=Pirellulimonas nuda TaxID=2528009 RepID=A0A518DDF6_9BACT|nr:malectin domain-containing carbohydrate-binding protein [Pirellulimonas nuda]QDU89508.1 Di-glucose binding within endoplasmic reticulum [Pirellulimonas nuda]